MITVLAGVNGAGKSSVGGSGLRAAGGEYFNPDEQSRALIQTFPGLSVDQANEYVWREDVERLRAAISDNTDWVFETTLGGRTVTGLLRQALDLGVPVRIWYCGLDSAEKHIERVRQRVAKGGHDIPEDRIRYRYVTSLRNLCQLAPACDALAVYDNSKDAPEGKNPRPRRVLQAARGRIEYLHPELPRWAEPIAGAFVTE